MKESSGPSPPRLWKNPIERVPILLIAALLIWIIAGSIMAANKLFSANEHDRIGATVAPILRIIFIEMLGAFGLFCAVVFLYALFEPRWAGKLVLYTASHAVQAVFIFAGGCGLVAMIIAIMERA